MSEQTKSAPDAVRAFTITRVFDASRELIWSALTDPEQLARFWGPEGTTVPLETVSIEPRRGGEFRATMVLIEDGTEFPMDAVYKEFIEPGGWSLRPGAVSPVRSS